MYVESKIQYIEATSHKTTTVQPSTYLPSKNKSKDEHINGVL